MFLKKVCPKGMALSKRFIRFQPPTIVNLPMSYEVLETTVAETLLYTVSVTDPTNDTIMLYSN